MNARVWMSVSAIVLICLLGARYAFWSEVSTEISEKCRESLHVVLLTRYRLPANVILGWSDSGLDAGAV